MDGVPPAGGEEKERGDLVRNGREKAKMRATLWPAYQFGTPQGHSSFQGPYY